MRAKWIGRSLAPMALYFAFSISCAYFSFSQTLAPSAVLAPLLSIILGAVVLAITLPLFRVMSYLDRPDEFQFDIGSNRTDWVGTGLAVFMVLSVIAGGVAISKIQMVMPGLYGEVFAPETAAFLAVSLLATLYSTKPDNKKGLRAWFCNFFVEALLSALLLFALVALLLQPGLSQQEMLQRLGIFYALAALSLLIPKEIAEPLAKEIFS